MEILQESNSGRTHDVRQTISTRALPQPSETVYRLPPVYFPTSKFGYFMRNLVMLLQSRQFPSYEHVNMIFGNLSFLKVETHQMLMFLCLTFSFAILRGEYSTSLNRGIWVDYSQLAISFVLQYLSFFIFSYHLLVHYYKSSSLQAFPVVTRLTVHHQLQIGHLARNTCHLIWCRPVNTAELKYRFKMILEAIKAS